MFGKKTGYFAAMLTAVLLLGGCGNDTAGNNLGGAIGGRGGTMADNGTTSGTAGYGYDTTGYGTNVYGTNGYGMSDSYGYGMGTYGGGTAYWDGYGINSGREMFQGNTERNTYGLRTGNLMQDTRDAVDDLTGGNTRTGSAVD